MVGYLLDLGDRHLSNIIIERITGKIMHVDFGDCFEVAMKREKYPEKVPFRLTRMMVGILEPCGVEGYYRHTCLATLDVLRKKNAKNSLMSMMEAFLYDPLIRWKLLAAEQLRVIRNERQQDASAPMAQSAGVSDARGMNSLSFRLGVGGADLVGGVRGLGRDAPRDIDELVRSMTVTGNLSASLRMQAERRRRERERERRMKKKGRRRSRCGEGCEWSRWKQLGDDRGVYGE